MRYDDSIFLLEFSMQFLFDFAYLFIVWHIAPLILFSTNNDISLSVNNSNFMSLFSKHACHANTGANKKLSGSSSYISILLF